MLETLNESKSKDKVWGRAAMAGSAGSAGSAHPLSSSRKSGGEGGAASDMQAGTNATRTGPQEVVHKDGDGDEDENRETFAIRDDACYVMARACEMFAMDLTKRSELVMEDQKRARFHYKSPTHLPFKQRGVNRSQTLSMRSSAMKEAKALCPEISESGRELAEILMH